MVGEEGERQGVREEEGVGEGEEVDSRATNVKLCYSEVMISPCA